MKRRLDRAFKSGRHGSMDDIHAMDDLNVVTKGGASEESKESDLFGFMLGEFTVAGDIESFLVPLKEWMLRQK